jgi:hypothetical protein
MPKIPEVKKFLVKIKQDNEPETEADQQIRVRMRMYVDVIANIENRIVYLMELLADEDSKLKQMSELELCYINIRKICELLSISCVIARGNFRDLENTSVFDEYKAGKILADIGKKHKDFFHFPTFQGESEKNPNLTDDCYVPMDESYLRSSYRRTHKYLHVGSLKNILKNREKATQDYEDDYQFINTFLNKTIVLLQNHRIKLENDKYIFCGFSQLNRDGLGGYIMVSDRVPEIMPPRLPEDFWTAKSEFPDIEISSENFKK